MERYALATWTGSGKEGRGKVTTRSGALKDANYSSSARFEEGAGTNPEELFAAAHASCFTMKVAYNISNAGHTPDSLDTRCDVKFNSDKSAIASSHLTIKARVQGLTKEKFDELVEDARKNCPISKSISVEVTVNATLEEHELA